MCIYCNTDKYRKIYEHHHGTIPTDDLNRTYDIHHVDGNRLNNHPDNLVALSINDHYNIHYNQGNFRSCVLLSKRLQIDGDTLRLLRKKVGDSLRDTAIYELINIDGSIFVGTREEFQKNYPTVHTSNLSKIINKKLPSTQGWRLSTEPAPVRNSFQQDNISHRFKHADGREFTGSRNDILDSEPEFLRKNRRSDSSNLWRLINKENGVKSIRGWRIG